MNLKPLKKIYKKFISFHESRYIEDVRSWFGVENLKISDDKIRSFYNIFYRPTFVEFWSDVKKVSFLENSLDYLKYVSQDNWDLENYIEFFTQEGLAKIKNGKFVLDEEINTFLLRPIEKKEILLKIKKIFGKFKKDESTFKLIERISNKKFNFKPNFDQLPITVSSAANIIEKICWYYPFYSGFLFVGDDDFVSVFISRIIENFTPFVIDVDDELIKTIEDIDEKIKLHRIDVRSEKKIKEKVMGFLTNPPYTEMGIEQFTKFGLNQFEDEGGFSFIVFGNQIVGNELLLIEKFFLQNNLKILEIAKSKIHYKFTIMHPEDKVILERFLDFFNEKQVRNSYMLTADIYVLSYLPWKIKRMKIRNQKMYSYI